MLVSQRKSTVKPLLDPKPYHVMEVKGTQVTVQRGSKEIKRNLAKVKILHERPERLRKKIRQEEQEEEEWWEVPTYNKEQPWG